MSVFDSRGGVTISTAMECFVYLLRRRETVTQLQKPWTETVSQFKTRLQGIAQNSYICIHVHGIIHKGNLNMLSPLSESVWGGFLVQIQILRRKPQGSSNKRPRELQSAGKHVWEGIWGSRGDSRAHCTWRAVLFSSLGPGPVAQALWPQVGGGAHPCSCARPCGLC